MASQESTQAIPEDSSEAVQAEPERVQRDIVVIGASAGGVEALEKLASGFPPEVGASIFVVLHVMATGTSVLPHILDRAGSLPASAAVDGEPIERGRIYTAPPNHHMILGDGQVRLTHGPRENGHRPAVDPLFRSAARAYGERVIGVILSGSLDDGTSGMRMIKQHGGATVVQDPTDALYSGMPLSAVENDAVDHIVPMRKMGRVICTLIDEQVEAAPGDREGEPHVDELEPEEEFGLADEPSGLTCPECGGALWETLEEGFVRFKCRVGHAYSPESLNTEQSKALEAALWAALRSIEERADLLRRLARRSGSDRLARKAHAADEHARVIREAVIKIGGAVDPTAEDEAEAR